MEPKKILKFIAFVLAFTVLWFGYNFFSRESLLSSGNTVVNGYVKSLEEGDQSRVKAALDEFVGNPLQAQSDEAYQRAIQSINYVDQQIEDSIIPSFVAGELSKNATGQTLYSGVFKLSGNDNMEDFLVMVLRRQGNEWRLANVYITATDPFITTDN